MCCACGGGTDYVAPEPTVCSEEGACNVGEEGDCVFAAEGFDCDGNSLEPVEPECENTDNGASDSYGDTCASWYDANETPGSYGCSGAYDTADFIAAEMCCACGGGTDYVAPEPVLCSEEGACNVGEEGDCVFAAEGFDCDGNSLEPVEPECENTDNGASDSYGDTCASWYDANETPGSYGCSGAYDTADFIAAEMCCACGGGTDYVAPEPTVCSEEGACNVGEEGDCVFAAEGFDCDGNSLEPVEPECENTDNGASDSYGDTCASWYDANETPGSYGCSGAYDTADFIAAEMCCDVVEEQIM